MRFARLSLHKYGQFEDCDLYFPAGEPDFHLIFGANEAGKSTTLSAAGDLLFGFPHNKSHDFRFDAALLRVGALLQDGARNLTVRRRRGNANTLLDEADQPLPEAALATMLHGRSGDEFRARFSLDHTRLREGGRAMVNAGGDVGQTLFAGGSGMLSAQAVLKALQAEAAAIWSENSRAKTTCKQASSELSDATGRVNKASMRPAKWKIAQENCKALADRRSALQAERRDYQEALQAVARRRALAVPAQQRADLLAGLPASPQVFDDTHERLHHEAARTIATAELSLAAANAAIAEAEAARAKLHVDRTVLDHGEAVVALVKDAATTDKAAADAVAVAAELAEQSQDADRLTRSLGLQPDATDRLLDHLPSPAALADLQDRAARRQALDSRLLEVREQLKRDHHALAEAAVELHAHEAATPGEALAAAIQHGRTATAAAGRLGDRRRDAAVAATSISAALRRLRPWTGDADALEAVAPPPEGDIRIAEAGLAEAAAALDRERAESQAGTDRLDRLRLEAFEVAAAGRAVTAAMLAAARARRADAWRPLRTHLGAGELTEPGFDRLAALAGFEAAQAAADSLADERFENAAASARLTELGVQTALAELDLHQAAGRVAAAQAVILQRKQAWDAVLAAAGLHPMTPATARQWQADRADTLQKLERLAQADSAESDDLATVSAARTALAAALCAEQAAPGQAAPFGAVLKQAEALADAAAACALRRAALDARAKAAKTAVEVLQRRAAEFAADIALWEAGWTQAEGAAGVALPAGSVAAMLPHFEQLRGRLHAVMALQRRIAGITRDRGHFDAEALALASSCGLVEPSLDGRAIAERLRLRHAAALGDNRAARELDATLTRRRHERDEAARAIAAAETALAPLLLALPGQSGAEPRAALAAAMLAAREARRDQMAIRALDQRILADGDGFPLNMLLAEAADADPLLLAREAARLQAVLDDLDARIAAAAQAVGEANHVLEAMDTGGEAALAAADEQQARASLGAEAEAYLLKRAQAVMLKWAVDTYRRRQESPLLTRASALFARLTLGRYAALEIDHAADRPRLVGLCADGRSLVPVDAMSDGTADQLFLALRLAGLEQSLDAGVTLPFLADDLFINFDDRRARAGFEVLGEIARHTQVLFFTHHDHLRAIAQDAMGTHTVPVFELAT